MWGWPRSGEIFDQKAELYGKAACRGICIRGRSRFRSNAAVLSSNFDYVSFIAKNRRSQGPRPANPPRRLIVGWWRFLRPVSSKSPTAAHCWLVAFFTARVQQIPYGGLWSEQFEKRGRQEFCRPLVIRLCYGEWRGSSNPRTEALTEEGSPGTRSRG